MRFLITIENKALELVCSLCAENKIGIAMGNRCLNVIHFHLGFGDA